MRCRAIKQGAIINVDGSIAPCCEFVSDSKWNSEVNIDSMSLAEYQSSDHLQKIQQQFDEGKFPAQCASCAGIEAAGSSSSWRLAQEKTMTDDDFTFYYRLSHVCNYRCMMCIPYSSSKIQADYLELKWPVIPAVITRYDLTEKRNTTISEFISRSTKVSILGGEPLYDKNVVSLLPQLSNKKEVSITTNGSKWDDYLTTIPNLILQFSIDGVGPRNDYIRTDSSWEIINDNIQRSINAGIKTAISSTISVYSVFGLLELLQYASKLPLTSHYFAHVEQPHFLSIAKLHPELVPKIKEIVKECFNFSKAPQTIQILKYILTKAGTEYSESDWSMFVYYTKTLDKHRNTTIKNYLPELAKYF